MSKLTDLFLRNVILKDFLKSAELKLSLKNNRTPQDIHTRGVRVY